MQPPVRSYNSGSPSVQPSVQRRRGGRTGKRAAAAVTNPIATDGATLSTPGATLPAGARSTLQAVPRSGQLRTDLGADVAEEIVPPAGEGGPRAEATGPDGQADARPVATSDEGQDGQAEAPAAAPGPVVSERDFEEIFTRFQTPLTNFIFRLVGNREQAYDLTQDVFVKAYRALAGGTTIQAAALSSWLYRIASNTATDALRRRRLIAWLPLSLFNEDRGVGAGMPGSDNANASQSGGTDESYPSAATAVASGTFASGYDGGRFEQHVADRELVQTVLDRLPEKYRVCLLLYEHEGFSCAEIAEVLSLSPSAVKMRLMRARERFIALYKQETGKS